MTAPFTIKQSSRGPRVNFTDSIPMHLLTADGRASMLPGKAVELTPVEILNHDTLLCVDEADLDFYAEALKAELQEQKRLWIKGDLAFWQPILFDRADGVDDSLLENIASLDTAETVEMLKILITLEEQPLTLIVIPSQDKSRQRFFEALCFLRHQQRSPHLRFIFLTGFARGASCWDSVINTGIFTLLNTLVPQPLGIEHIRSLGAAQQQPAHLTSEALEEMLTYTGGQPTLLYAMLAWLSNNLSDEDKCDQLDIQTAARLIERSLPQEAAGWQNALRNLLNNPLAGDELFHSVAHCVMGHNRDLNLAPVTSTEVPLLLTGWCGVFGHQWTMPARLRKDLARSVLREVDLGRKKRAVP